MYQLILAAFFLTGVGLYAQDTIPAPKPVDSLEQALHGTKNPTTAVLLSLPLPGLGQLYNEQYWKVPIFTGACTVTAVLFFKNNTDFNNTTILYEKAVAEEANPAVIDRLFRQKEAYRDNRDLSAFVFITTYILAAVDAYVGAHLYSFDVGDDLSVNLGPTRSQILAMNFRLQL
ncbi:MAG: hypothetical protein HYX66_07195 [Ignavibacteria bacterium]|nr:hypothetical protein [Ignavibacteria bacterium]